MAKETVQSSSNTSSFAIFKHSRISKMLFLKEIFVETSGSKMHVIFSLSEKLVNFFNSLRFSLAEI